MQLVTRLAIVSALAILALPLSGAMTASAQNLLTNPGFETGDFTGWEVIGAGPSSFATIGSPDNGPSAGGTNHAFLDNQAQALALLIKQSTAAGSAAAGMVNYSFDLKLGEAALGGVFLRRDLRRAGWGRGHWRVRHSRKLHAGRLDDFQRLVRGSGEHELPDDPAQRHHRCNPGKPVVHADRQRQPRDRFAGSDAQHDVGCHPRDVSVVGSES